MYDIDVPQCIVCCSSALPSLRETKRDVVHTSWNGCVTYYSICGGCIRLSWKDATKLEGVCQSWEDVDYKCKEWAERLLHDVARHLRVPEEEMRWA